MDGLTELYPPLTVNEETVLCLMEQAVDMGLLVLMTASKTAWLGNLWVNRRTAESLERKGFIRIGWAFYDGDDHHLYLTEEER